MRRLLASVAVLAAVLAAPSTALALDAPAVTAPSATSSLPVLSWSEVPGALFYHVFRADASCESNPGAGAFSTPVGGDFVSGSGTYSYTDNTPSLAEGRYCYFVQADDLVTQADSTPPASVLYDKTAPIISAVSQTGGNGCSLFTLTGATATDNFGPITTLADGQPFPFSPLGDGVEFDPVSVNVIATDAAGNASAPFPVAGTLLDSSRPPAPVLEVDTDPAQQRATLSWQPVVSAGAQVTFYTVHTRGPQGSSDLTPLTTTSVVVPIAQVDATYEYTLTASDVCGPSAPSVRLVRLNDATPPTMPIVAGPSFNPATHVLTLSWVASTDNIQVDHYQILRNGVPLGSTDSTSFVDVAPPQHANLSYVVRAVDTNGNTTDSAPAPYSTPDWTPPTAPVPTIVVTGTTVTVRWSAAADNVGVVGYDVLRDDKVKGSMTASIRSFPDLNVPPGVHTWTVRARDDAGLSAVSAPITAKIVKRHSSAKVVSLKRVGDARGGAARYSLAGPARLLLDLRVIGTLPKAVLRVYVQNGKGRITAWRGVPGSSSPRERLHSALVRHGYVTIHLGRTFHSGRIRLVLITSGRMVVVGTGKHQPSIKAG
jgi:hypothetical protein